MSEPIKCVWCGSVDHPSYKCKPGETTINPPAPFSTLAMQEIQIGVLLFIWSDTTKNGLLEACCVVAGFAFVVGGVVKSLTLKQK